MYTVENLVLADTSLEICTGVFNKTNKRKNAVSNAGRLVPHLLKKQK
jgi:hypothetical protein